MTKINKYSNIPLYCQLKNIISERIESCKYKENTKIPSEQEFCDEFDVSRPTVRQAISELTKNGIVFKQKGKGTFVCEKKSTVKIHNYNGFADSILDTDVPSEKHIIYAREMTLNDKKELKNIFNSSNYDSFAEIMYILENKNTVFSLNKSYLPLKYFPDIIEMVNSKRPSYDILRDKYALIPAASRTSLEIIFTEQEDATYLQIQPGQALILVKNKLFSKNGNIVEYIESKYRADKCKFIFENKK